jgi:hypothetical protein
MVKQCLMLFGQQGLLVQALWPGHFFLKNEVER